MQLLSATWTTRNQSGLSSTNILKAYVQSQREEIVWALSGRGQYRLNPEFAHHGVSTQEWTKMRTDQQQQVLEKFEKATLPVHAQASSEPK